jgi:hypothetical protein
VNQKSPSENLSEETSQLFTASLLLDVKPEQLHEEREKSLNPAPEVRQLEVVLNNEILDEKQESLLNLHSAPKLEEALWAEVAPESLAEASEEESSVEEEAQNEAYEPSPKETPQEFPSADEIKIYRDGSRYSDMLSSTIYICIIKKSIRVLPEFHLQKLCEAIENGLKEKGEVKMLVSFGEGGTDAGGLSRDFLDDLSDGLVQSKLISFKSLAGSSLVLPHAIMADKNLQPISILDKDEQQLYRCLGILMIYCYQSMSESVSKHYLLGRRFDEGLFKAALSLTAEEIDIPFEELTLQVKLKMCQALLDVRLEEGMDLDFLKKRVDWISHYDRLDDHALSEAALSVHYSEFLPQHFTINGEFDNPDMDKIKQNREEFKELLISSLFIQKADHGQFGLQLAPIHAIAQGMKSICNPTAYPEIDDNHHWDSAIRQISYQDFSNTVQGLFDRKEIANQIKLGFLWGNPKVEIEKKLRWLQDWIKDEKKGATEDELKKLLKYLTGSTSLPKDKVISVSEQCEPFYPIPKADTCFLKMKLAPVPSSYGSNNDHTKKNFIKSLKELALNPTFSFLG